MLVYFKVKIAYISDEVDLTPNLTPNPSPPLPQGYDLPEETRFVQANYQSLEMVVSEAGETEKNPFIKTRLSMSARFLRKRGYSLFVCLFVFCCLLCLFLSRESLRSSGSPELADDTERPIRKEGIMPL